MNILHRVLNGRVVKPRTDQQATGHFVTSPSSRRHSMRLSGPAKSTHTSQNQADFHEEVRIKHEVEDEGEESLHLPRAESCVSDNSQLIKDENELDEEGNVSNNIEQFGEDRQADEGGDETESEGTSDDEDQDEEMANDSQDLGEDGLLGEYEGGEEDVVNGEHDDEGSLVPSNDGSSSSQDLDREHPIPSIESDKDEEPPKKKTSPFLHGKNRKIDSTSLDGGTENDGVAVDEDFENELRGEFEESLLIHERDLRDYLKHKRQIAGVETWPPEACRLYKLLYLRGLYPLMRNSWRRWELLDHPVPAELFTPVESDDKILFKPVKSQYHASKFLRGLFQLQGAVLSYRQCGVHDKISKIIKRALFEYVRWAERDIDFYEQRDYISPIFTIAYVDAQSASSGQTVVQKCQGLVRQYRKQYTQRGIEHYPRVIYIFVIIQHVVLIFTADTQKDGDEEPFPFAELDMSKKTHWLDSALAIAITVMVARQSLVAHRESFPEIERVEDDPDL